MTREHRKSKLDKSITLPFKRQCELLEISRSSAYYKPVGESAENIELMKEIDKVHLKYPFMGHRRIVGELADLGYQVNRKKVMRLMRLMGIYALYPKKKTTIANKAHKVYPYLGF